jgi:hypothetical protein
MSPVASVPPAHPPSSPSRALRGILFALLALMAAPAMADGLAAAAPKDVDVALVLAADVSLSMDETELSLQRNGYAEALESPEVISAIGAGRRKRIAITYFEWGGVSQQVVVAPWTIVDGPEAARRLAETIRGAPRNSLDRTAVGEALAFAGTLFDAGGLRAERSVIDISGDGISNTGRSVSKARTALIERGVTINGLPIMPRADEWLSYMPALDAYYDECVAGGAGSFTLPVAGMDTFAAGLRIKLVLEIAGIPRTEPRVMPASGPAPMRCQDFD